MKSYLDSLREKINHGVDRKSVGGLAERSRVLREEKPGDVIEFGCGCCAGTVGTDELVDHDRTVQGQKARAALEVIRQPKEA